MKRLLLLALPLLPHLPAPAALAQREAGAARAWEHETSDVPVDPRVRFGALGNGVRWAWARNGEPRERAYLRLHVDVGSLAEEDDERGMAHFLEHMAFNGSASFPPGSLVEWFQGKGMDFGADTNAHTSFSETVYQIDLPHAGEGAVREGLLVLSDFAARLTLAEAEVQKEKGVIDAEQRERDSAAYRLGEEQMRRAFAGTRYPERMPIGTHEARAGFDADAVRAFYDRWYRPENLTLIAVGDFRPDLDVGALVADAFGRLAPRVPGDPAAEPPVGQPASYAPSFVVHEDEIPVVTLTVQRLRPWVEEPYDVEQMTRDLPLGYARRMLNLRFDELAKREDAPFLSASVDRAAALRVFDGEALRITCAPERWRDALLVCEQELRRAVEHGFHRAELEEARARALRYLDEAVERERTQHSLGLLGEVLLAAEERFVPTDAATARSILRPAIEALTVEGCSAAFREAWSGGPVSLTASGGLDLGERGAETLRAAYEESRAVAVEAGEETLAAEFAYASRPLEGEGEERLGIAERRHVEDLDFHAVRFENGVLLNVKRTDFDERQILVNVDLGEGQLTLPPERHALALVADRVFDAGGLGAHARDDLRRLLAGKQVGVSWSVAEESFTFRGGATQEDLLLELELIAAFLTDPGWRDEGLVQLRRELPLLFERFRHDPQGPLLREFLPDLHGDPRFGFPPEEPLAAVGMDDVRAWLAPHLREAPIEVTLVGDLDVEAAIEAAARTFGRLPARRAPREWAEHRVVPPAALGLRRETAVDTEVPKSLVFLAFPTTDGIDPEVRRRLAFLGRVLDDRLRVQVREELGAAYSPTARAESSRVYPGSGLLMVQAMADPSAADALVEACLAAAEALGEEGPSEEEVRRLREPVLKELRDARRENGWWLGVLSYAQRRPETLDETRGLETFYDELDAEDLAPLAERYLQRERASVLVVHPRDTPPRADEASWRR